ncbi:SRPBCC family protein [Polaribacter uvawellassae]|uniref:SRPBCC family protein n=1 Tax=Polaribacter uvawellassae TaxID=3133495 RepID=UPI003219D9BC
MKGVKIILGIITALVIVFFSTGLIIKETTYQVKVEIDKPLDTVFSVFNNQELMTEWLKDVKSITPINVKPGIVGSEYKMVVENQGKEMEMNEKVMAFIPNKKVTLFFDADDMLKTDDYNFSFSEGKTTIVKDVICKSESYLMSCLFPYFKGTFTDIDQKYLEDFKIYIEKQ